jgi:hypothetical protein
MKIFKWLRTIEKICITFVISLPFFITLVIIGAFIEYLGLSIVGFIYTIIVAIGFISLIRNVWNLPYKYFLVKDLEDIIYEKENKEDMLEEKK